VLAGLAVPDRPVVVDPDRTAVVAGAPVPTGSAGEELAVSAGVAISAMILLFAVFAGISWAATMLGSWVGSF
jgi:hypothetical protein